MRTQRDTAMAHSYAQRVRARIIAVGVPPAGRS